MKKYHLAISLSWRFECLNLFLDIVKNNFQSEIITHVFCNLSTECFDKYKDNIDFSLIDYFHHLPDINCNENNSVHLGHKIECKRRQPVDLFINTMKIMSSKINVESFIYTECDVFPINEENYLKNLKLENNEFMSRYIPQNRNSKLPNGYFSPGPIYFSKKCAKHASTELEKNCRMYLSAGMSFEGMLGMLVSLLAPLGCKFSPFKGNYHTGSTHVKKNLCRETYSTHQHNIFNLYESLIKFNITRGKWIKQIFDLDQIEMAWKGKSVEKYNHYYDMSNIMKKNKNFGLVDFMEKYKHG